MTYLLHIYIKNSRCIRIGKFGKYYFKQGNYIYVGSAKKNLLKRIERHRRKRKKKFWHIDYLLQYASLKKVWIGNLSEEKVADICTKIMEVPVLGFGSSDKKSTSHLFFSKKVKDFSEYAFCSLTDLKKRL
ncbi:MAG: DUF123 domain-containing protein [candidate division WOR-3 bacterium]|nr:MAG: DUF123 domain-containing protein [candidate division WOR-3 bacterium]